MTRLAIAAMAVAIAVTPTFETPVFPTDEYLSGCTVMVHEDGTQIAECPEDGEVLIFDADGQRWANDAGVPIRAPHQWYVVEVTR